MARATIPVDLTNPGHVFACLGFMEAAEILLGCAEGGFSWGSDTGEEFSVQAAGDDNPIAVVLAFLAEAEVVVLSPAGMNGPWPADAEPSQVFPAATKALRTSDGKGLTASPLPIHLRRGNETVPVSHWLERPPLNPFKLFAGKQVGARLAANMLVGDPAKKASKGFRHIYPSIAANGYEAPFDAVCPVGGRFGFDARGSWDAIRIGTSLDQQGVLVSVAPHVELLAAIGLENTRPDALSTYEFRYSTWKGVLPIPLCRVALFAPGAFLRHEEYRSYRGHLGDDQQYKKVFFAAQEK